MYDPVTLTSDFWPQESNVTLKYAVHYGLVNIYQSIAEKLWAQ